MVTPSFSMVKRYASTGIDTPELKQTCLQGDQRSKLVVCLQKSYWLEKIGNNTPECISEGKDAYKRTLAECFR